jgi:hypothetical protein
MMMIHFSPVEVLPNMVLQQSGPVSKAFLDRGLTSFHQAAAYVSGLPYGANTSSDNSMILLKDGFGTCLTKHGIIARLAEELGLSVYRCEGFYPLTDEIVTGAGKILAEHGLTYIPRTHCFLVFEEQYVDLTEGNCTGKNGLVEKYFKIFRVKPEQTEAEVDQMYRTYFSEVCKTDPAFARMGIEGMFQVLERCRALNTAACEMMQTSVQNTR